MTLQELRDLIPALKQSSYFQVGGIAPSPQPVIDTMLRWLNYQNQGPADPGISAEISALEPRLVDKLAAFIRADPAEIMLNTNCTIGINVVAWGFNWQPGDVVVLSDHEHPGNLLTWYNLVGRYGIQIRWLKIQNDEGKLLQDLTALLSAHPPRVVSLSHVSRRTGIRLPARRISDLVHHHGALLLLDGAQSFGAIPLDMREIDADFYTFSGHNWSLGPKGTGGFYVKSSRLEFLQPSWIGSHSQKSFDAAGNYELLDSARRFEFGTHDIATIAGWEKAIDMLSAVGWSQIFETVADLTSLAKRSLSQIPGLTILTPEPYSQSSGIVTFQIAGLTSAEICKHLYEQHKILAGGLERDLVMVRLCIHAINTPEEIAALVAALQRIGNSSLQAPANDKRWPRSGQVPPCTTSTPPSIT